MEHYSLFEVSVSYLLRQWIHLVVWHHHHHLRSISLQYLKPSAADSWSWKSLLLLRPLAEQFVFCVLGNGRQASFWFNYWTPLGPLIKYFGGDGTSDLMIARNAVVVDALDSQGQRLSPPTSPQTASLHSHLSTLVLPLDASAIDSYYWATNGTQSQHFIITKTWEVIRPINYVQDWSISAWFKGTTPKH